MSLLALQVVRPEGRRKVGGPPDYLLDSPGRGEVTSGKNPFEKDKGGDYDPTTNHTHDYNYN